MVYDYTTFSEKPKPFGIGGWDQPNVKPQQGEYVILTGFNGTREGEGLLQNPAPIMEPGEILTILVDMDIIYNLPSDAQFKLTTSEGNIFVSTILMGQSTG